MSKLLLHWVHLNGLDLLDLSFPFSLKEVLFIGEFLIVRRETLLIVSYKLQRPANIELTQYEDADGSLVC